MLAVRHSVEDQFHPAGDSHFIEDAQQVFLDGMFAETQFAGDCAIGQAVGNERDHLLFARRQQSPAIGVDDSKRWHLRYRVQQVIHLLAVHPNLSLENTLDAFAEHRKGSAGKKKNTLGPRPQGAHHQLAVIVLRQQYGRDLRIRNP